MQNPGTNQYMGGGAPFPKPPQQPMPGQHNPNQYNQPQQNNKPIEYVEQDPGASRESDKPQEWLKPKIFGGKNNKKS
jgi:hypothetical protein